MIAILGSLTMRPQNARMLASDMMDALRDNEFRRFVYGLTVENSTARLWYCDRDELACSDEFEFLRDEVSLSLSRH